MQKLLMQLQGMSEERRKIERTICVYCHQFHSNNELVDNLCPKMIQFVKNVQDQHSYKCMDCFGEGTFQKVVECKIYETSEKYQQRLQAWRQNGQINQKPQRKLFNEQKTQQAIICKKCDGKGKLYRVCYKKTSNYRESPIQVNAFWVAQKMKGEKCEEGFKCIICMQESEVTSLTLHCSHSFHLKCIYRWLKTNQQCPICRKTDPFIDLNLIPSQIKENQPRAVRTGNRGQRNNWQSAQEIQRRNYFNLIVDQPHPNMFHFGFGSQYSEDEEW